MQAPAPRNTIQVSTAAGQPTFMKMITMNPQQSPTVVGAPATLRPQLMPVILNPSFRPRAAAPTQSVIIRAAPPQQQQQTQQVIIDPRSFNVIQTVDAAGQPQRQLQYKLVTKAPVQQPQPRPAQPVARPQPIILNRSPSRIVRPALRPTRPVSNIPRPQQLVQQLQRQRMSTIRQAAPVQQPSKMVYAAGPAPRPAPSLLRPLQPGLGGAPRPPVPTPPVVEVRPPFNATPSAAEDIEESISSAVLHKQPPMQNSDAPAV